MAPAGDMAAFADAEQADDSGFVSHRALALLAALGLLIPGEIACSEIVRATVLGLFGAAVTGVSLLLVCVVASTTSRDQLERIDWWLLGAGVAAVIIAVAAVSHSNSSYISDEAALVHGGAFTLLHGHDPYGANLGWTFARYGATAQVFLTYLMNGGTVHALGYPALPLLVTLPFVALKQDISALTIVDGGALAVAAAVMFILLPKRLRPVAVIICADIPILLTLVVDGLNSVLMLAALTACAYRWAAVGTAGDDGRGSLGRTGVARAVCLGLAISTNQLAWFLTPFLILGTYLGARDRLGVAPARRIAVSYLAVALLVFLVINSPFIAWGPHVWLHGVLLPVMQHAVPYGQGLVGLTAFARIGGGRLQFYTYAAVLLYLALLVLFWMRFERVARCVVLFPLVALYISDRSLASYWLVLIGVVLVSVVCSGISDAPSSSRAESVGRPAAPRLPGTLRDGVLFAPALICLVIALGTPAPLNIEVISSATTRGGQNVDRLHVLVRNSSGRTLTPRFALNSSGMLAGFWRVIRGPAKLNPGTTAEYVLHGPDAQAEPSAGSSYIVQAVTDAPETISSSVPVNVPKAS